VGVRNRGIARGSNEDFPHISLFSNKSLQRAGLSAKSARYWTLGSIQAEGPSAGRRLKTWG
jgi:hypothetical protein